MSRGIVESTLLPSYSNTWQSSRFPEQHRRYHHSSPNFSLQPTNNNPGRSVIRRFLFHDLFEKRSPCSLAADDVIVSGSSLGVHPESKAPGCRFVGIYGAHCARTSMDDSSVPTGFASLWQSKITHSNSRMTLGSGD